MHSGCSVYVWKGELSSGEKKLMVKGRHSEGWFTKWSVIMGCKISGKSSCEV